MQIFFRLAFLYMLGSVGGWVIELFFRRFFSTKKWINPGFLNGPYLPMYGAGTLILYGACFIPLPRWALVLLLLVSLTLLEYITGLIFIKGMHIKLWDYSAQWGNVQGIICPLFSLLWGAIAAGFVYVLFGPLHAAAVWAAENAWMIFFIGAFYGIFFVDVCISFDISLRSARRRRNCRRPSSTSASRPPSTSGAKNSGRSGASCSPLRACLCTRRRANG